MKGVGRKVGPFLWQLCHNREKVMSVIVEIVFNSVAIGNLRSENHKRDVWDVMGVTYPDKYISATNEDIENAFEERGIPSGYHIGQWELEDEVEECMEIIALFEAAGVLCWRLNE